MPAHPTVGLAVLDRRLRRVGRADAGQPRVICAEQKLHPTALVPAAVQIAVAGGVRVADVAVQYDERYWYPDDGSIVWFAGYSVVDAQSGRYLSRDAPELAARELIVCGVAGAARFHDEVLQGDDASPGRPLELRRDPRNEHDSNAVAVLTARGGRLGFVPREVAESLAQELDAGRPWSAVVLRERRASPRDRRSGLTMLLAPGEAIELRPRRPG